MTPRLVDELLKHCTFPSPGTSVTCALSGGADSTALVALAVGSGCSVSAVHVNHHLRPTADDDAHLAVANAERLGVECGVVDLDLDDGPNLEARARAARRAVLGPDALMGHTADDQAETVLLALLRGSGAAGLSAIGPGPQHPILALRATDTRALCATLGLAVADDATNRDLRFRRNRVRHQLLPLLDDIAERDVTPLLTRTADLLRADDELLEALAQSIDPTDIEQLVGAPRPLAARAIRRWLTADGYPPDAAAVARVLDVASGANCACEVGGGVRIERHDRRLVRFSPPPASR